MPGRGGLHNVIHLLHLRALLQVQPIIQQVPDGVAHPQTTVKLVLRQQRQLSSQKVGSGAPYPASVALQPLAHSLHGQPTAS